MENTQSETIESLAKALCKAQSEMKAAPKETENHFFKSKYASLKAVWDACREPLTSNGLSVIQTMDGGEGEVVVITTLLHESGQWVKGRLPIKPTKSDPQGIGSAISYAKRYSLGAMVGVCAADEDDDGEGAMDRDNKHQKGPKDNGNGSFQAKADVQEVFGKHEVKQEPRPGGASPAQKAKIKGTCERIDVSGKDLRELAFATAGEELETLSKAGASKIIKVLEKMEKEINGADKPEQKEVPF